MPGVERTSWWQRLWEPFWAIPVAISVGAVALGIVLPEVDSERWSQIPVVFHGGPAGARSVLGTITSAMISVTGLVFSITMVVLQLASSQFTPRVLGAFLDSRITQATLGVFTGTFLYALTVLRSVRGAADGRDAFVPQLATTMAYVGVIASVALFLAFIHHITTSIQVLQVVRRTGGDTTRTLDHMIPEDQGEAALRGEPPRWAPGPGEVSADILTPSDDRYLTEIDYVRLVELGSDRDCVVVLTRQVGDYVPHGGVVGQVWGQPGGGDQLAEAAERASRLLSLEPDRTIRQDVGFGIRQLVDIAERALSPGVNDPTTAVQVIDALHSVLRRAVQRRMPSAHVTDASGRVRLVYRPQTVEEHLRLAVREIAWWGRESVQVPDALRHMLTDLATVSRPEYRGPLADLRRLVDNWEEAP